MGRPGRRTTAALGIALALATAGSAQAAAPSDPLFDLDQWALWSTGPLNAPAAWELGGQGAGTVVALLDTGVDETHPDLAPALWTNPGEVPGNGSDDDGDGVVDDVHGVDLVGHDGDPADDEGHGTHVAGIVAAQADGEGTVGLAPEAKLMAVKVLDLQRRGSTQTVADGIRYALAHGADVINVSVNGDLASPALVAAAQAAAAAGVPIVASAGNDGRDLDERPSYPASLPGNLVLAVAAQVPGGKLASFSNTGASTVDVAAPGVDITSTELGGGYEERAGTSMAAPLTTATLALLHGARPDLRGDALVDALRAGLSHPAALDGQVAGGALDPVGALARVVDPSKLAASGAAAAAATRTTPASAPTRLSARVVRHRRAGQPRTLLAWKLTGPTTGLSGFELVTSAGHVLAEPGAAARSLWLRTRAGRVRVKALGPDGRALSTATLSLR